jgi:hypothetical protein
VALSACGIGLTAASFSEGSVVAVDGGAQGYGDSGSVTTAPKQPTSTPGSDAAVGLAVGSGSGSGGALASASPLCGSPYAMDSGVTCNPDLLGDCTPPSLDDAGVAAAGDAGASPGAARFGCHVTAVRAEAGMASSAPVCSAAGAGKADAVCHASNDCEPGYECVVNAQHLATDGAAQDGVCRRYCCDNTCADPASYCDIETTVEGSVAVPVCATHDPTASADGGAACELLNDATCGAGGLSCQVVNVDTGAVACITPGTAAAGQSCETTHCAAGLSCIAGYFPDRRCAQLCNHDNDECPAGWVCTPSLSLSTVNALIGVCTQ